MVAPGSQWPPLSGGRENSARNINERILDANYDVRQLLNHISSNSSVKVPRPVLGYLKSVQELTTDLIKNPIGQDWKQQFEQLRQETSQIKQDIHAVRIATATVAGPSTRVRSYVDAVKNAPPPTHFLSSHGSASTNPATPSDLIQDRQVIVKLGDSDGIKHFRSQTPAEITKLAEKARVKAAKATYGITVASAKFVAARQLKSGDISLSLRTAKEAEIMRCHRTAWVKHLWKGSEVRLPSWGVVIHDVNVRSLGVNSATGIGEQGRKQSIIKQLLTENLFNWGDTAEITQVSWLVLPEGKKSGSLIVEFTSPHTANNAIDTGTLWDSEVLTTVLYDRAARIRQCHNCQKYGHIGNTCSNETKCFFCAEKHHSRDCQRKKDATLSERKCANCGGAHNGWSKQCPDFINEIERVQALAQTRERHHQVPAYLSMAAGRTPAATTVGPGSSGGSGSGTSTKDSSGWGRRPPDRPGVSTRTTSLAQPASSEGPTSNEQSTPPGDTEMQEVQQEPQPEDTPTIVTFVVGEVEASAIGESIRQSVQRPARGVDRSIHAPAETRSEPPRRRAPSRASTISSTTTRSKSLIRSVLDTDVGKAQKRARDEAYVLEDQEAVLPGTPSTSAPAASASEYQPSVLSRTSGNARKARRHSATSKYSAAGKENAIFKTTTTTHTPGPRGKNKRTLDGQVNLTMSAPSVKFTNRAGIQEERRTRQFTKKHTETTSNE
ncbi:hypothetical protein N7472_010977 [Penicillium cf. griseofulvum]|uniref:CCHC-type domain-containing protein n=1 Tax=Penicillium cf. griseofulvum TaxID=2972120 RepID=A0A9W9IXW2_9EURO|nr:hypothetical protein N7472_010977 [Penicillium cf. griseofulvum]